MDLNSSDLLYTTAQEELLIYDEESSFGLTEESFVGTGYVTGVDYGDPTEYQERNTILVDGGEHFGVSAVTFDTYEELLWMGNQGGHVTSYYGSDVQKYTSFQVHPSEEVRSIFTVDSGILALTPTSLRCQLRRGLPVFTHCSENMAEMQCLLQLKTNPDNLLIGGHTHNIIQFNLTTGQETDLVEVGEAGCAIMRQAGKVVACADPTGRVDLRDPISLKLVNSVETHTGSLNDFDLHNNLLVTCGFSNRGGGLVIDNFLMVFDLRMMRAASPIPTMIDPLLLRFMPSFSSRVAVASMTGQVQLLETVALSEPDVTVYQLEGSTVGSTVSTSLDVSQLCQAFAVGDSAGSLHVLSSTTNPVYNPFSRPTEFADPVVEEYPSVSLDDPLICYSELVVPPNPGAPHLLSDWPQHFTSKRYRRMPIVDNEILRTMKMQGTIGYAPNPNNRRRNQVPDWYVSGGGPPRCISRLRQDHGDADGSHASGLSANSPSNFVAIPKRYRKLDIKYLKSDDHADIEIFNKTGLSGLEATLPNSYCNAMLQVLYFTDAVRRIVCKHACSIEFCVTCEVGFLFHMLASSKGGIPCHSGNLLRSLRSAKEASALRLILPDSATATTTTSSAASSAGGTPSPSHPDLPLLIQSWNRFILHQMHSEMLESKRKAKEPRQPQFVYKDTDFPTIDPQSQRKRKIKPELTEEIIEDTTKGETEFSKLFGSKQTHIFSCLKCSGTTSKEATLLAHNLSYPTNLSTGAGPNSQTSGQTGISNNRGGGVGGGGDQKEFSFCEVLKNSIVGSQVTPAWCDACHKFQPTLQERRVKSLPQILSINCGNTTEQEKRFWRDQMDHVVMKVASGTSVNSSTQTGTSANNSGANSEVKVGDTRSGKLCRYGNACTRPACRFRHPNQMPVSNSGTGGGGEGGVPIGPLHLYYSHSWVPSHIRIKLSSSGNSTAGGDILVEKVTAMELEQNNLSHSSGQNTAASDISTSQVDNKVDDSQSVVYDLYAVVCFVNEENRKNIVSIINVGPSYHSTLNNSAHSQWYIFNDICVTPVSAQEAVWFSMDWKVPCILYWRQHLPNDGVAAGPICNTAASIVGGGSSLGSALMKSPDLHNPITADVFLDQAKSVHVTPLAAHEIPKPGDIVAMDAEFVTLNQEESELRSDGKLATIRPSHMSVARISCVRGSGPLVGTPFIDDYISTQEQVFDYLTKFSGIKPGDLDATCSNKNLTTLKSTYLKIRYLIDNGVKFVGHGLNNDFRVINLVVPQDQIIDTVHLFYLPHQRMVSLRFLAWHFLGLKIQSETHDSIEDARTALELFKKYQELESSGRLPAALEEMYAVGKSLQWAVPQ